MNWYLHANDLAMLVVRVSIGATFALNGYYKVFYPQRHASFVATLKSSGVYNHFTEWSVCSIELLAGLGVLFGFLTPVSALGLLVIICTAVCTDSYKKLAGFYPLGFGDLVSDYLYLPEVLYAIMLVAIIVSGPGPYSLDSLILWFFT